MRALLIDRFDGDDVLHDPGEVRRVAPERIERAARLVDRHRLGHERTIGIDPFGRGNRRVVALVPGGVVVVVVMGMVVGHRAVSLPNDMAVLRS